MPEYTIVTYTHMRADDDDEAMRHARVVHGASARRIVVKHGSVALRDYDRATRIERVAEGRAAREVRRRLAGAS